ncbi:hypothetical protein DRI50_12060, partial [candidate division KSB1 bacterium]
ASIRGIGEKFKLLFNLSFRIRVMEEEQRAHHANCKNIQWICILGRAPVCLIAMPLGTGKRADFQSG